MLFRSKNNEEDSLATIIIQLFLEIKDIANSRRVQTDMSVISIIKEQHIKWLAILNQIGIESKISYNLFLTYIIKKLPDTEKILINLLK